MQRLSHIQTRRLRRALLKIQPQVLVARLRLGPERTALLFSSLALVGLVHVLDVMFEQEQVRRCLAVDLERAPVVPLDCAFYLFAIFQDDDHRRMRVNLLFVVEDFRIGFIRGRNSLAHLHGTLRGLRLLSASTATRAFAMSRRTAVINALPLRRKLAPLVLNFG